MPRTRCAAPPPFSAALFEVARDHWYPMLVVVDEAQLFAPAVAGEVSDEARKLSLGAMTNLMCRGRKRGLAGVIATQRLAKLAKNVAAEASNFLMGRTFLDIDMARAADLLGMERRQAEAFRDLERGAFIGLGPAIARRPVAHAHRSGRDGGSRRRARNCCRCPRRHGPGRAGPDLRARRSRTDRTSAAPARAKNRAGAGHFRAGSSRRPPPQFVAAPPPERTDAEREAEIDVILRQMLAEPRFAFQPAAALHQDFLVRWRIRRLARGLPDLATFRRRATIMRARMAYPGDADEDAWTRAIDLVQRAPDDLQGVFLLLSRAAVTGQTCPPDEEIAQFFGSHSPSRARRMLDQLEKTGAIVARTDFQQFRIIAFPELGVETAARHDAEAS